MNNRIIFPITPVAAFKVLPQDVRLFRIPEKCYYIPSESRYRRGPKSKTEELIPVDSPLVGCQDYKDNGCCKHTLSKYGRARKRRILRYNVYKRELKALADAIGFTIPKAGMSLYFYIPIAASEKKYKKKKLHGQIKESKPDIDNYEKGFYDSLTDDDSYIGQLSGHGKFWINEEVGYIEVLLNQPIYDPFGVIVDNFS